MTALRDQVLRVRVSPAERSDLEAKAEECDRPLSTYLREVGLGYRPRARPHRAERHLAYHLGRIGNNLNQLARAANATRRVELSSRLDQVLRQLVEALEQLL